MDREWWVCEFLFLAWANFPKQFWSVILLDYICIYNIILGVLNKGPSDRAWDDAFYFYSGPRRVKIGQSLKGWMG